MAIKVYKHSLYFNYSINLVYVSISLSHCVCVLVCVCEFLHMHLDLSGHRNFYAIPSANLKLILNLFLNTIYHQI